MGWIKPKKVIIKLWVPVLGWLILTASFFLFFFFATIYWHASTAGHGGMTFEQHCHSNEPTTRWRERVELLLMSGLLSVKVSRRQWVSENTQYKNELRLSKTLAMWCLSDIISMTGSCQKKSFPVTPKALRKHKDIHLCLLILSSSSAFDNTLGKKTIRSFALSFETGLLEMRLSCSAQHYCFLFGCCSPQAQGECFYCRELHLIWVFIYSVFLKY